MDAEGARGGPVVHGLPGDQGQPSVDADLGHLLVLHTVRPAPQDLALAQLGDVVVHRFGQQRDVALGDEPLAGAQAYHEWSQRVVGDAEAFAVALFEEDPLSYVRGDPVEVAGVQREAELVLLAGGGEYSEAHQAHVGRLISDRTRCAPGLPFPEGDAETDDGVRGALGTATVLPSPSPRASRRWGGARSDAAGSFGSRAAAPGRFAPWLTPRATGDKVRARYWGRY